MKKNSFILLIFLNLKLDNQKKMKSLICEVPKEQNRVTYLLMFWYNYSVSYQLKWVWDFLKALLRSGSWALISWPDILGSVEESRMSYYLSFWHIHPYSMAGCKTCVLGNDNSQRWIAYNWYLRVYYQEKNRWIPLFLQRRHNHLIFQA